MKTIKHIFCIGFVILSYTSFTQNNFSGVVSGIDGPVKGAKVSIIETNTSVATDAEGKFIMESNLETIHIKATFKKMTHLCSLDQNQKSIQINLVPDDKKLYKIITERNEIRLCDIYIDHYPQGQFIDLVNQTKEKLFFIEAYNIAASQFTDTALRNYLLLYPSGTYKDKALDAIEIAAWQKAKYENTIKSYQEYLNQYPTGKAASLAKEKMAGLK